MHHQAVAIENTVDGALGWAVNLGETSGKDFSDLGCSPRGFFTLDAQDFLLHLERELVGIAIGSPAAVTQTIEPNFVVPIPKLIAGPPGDTKFPAQLGHL